MFAMKASRPAADGGCMLSPRRICMAFCHAGQGVYGTGRTHAGRDVLVVVACGGAGEVCTKARGKHVSGELEVWSRYM
jgi:hypothetical protein